MKIQKQQAPLILTGIIILGGILAFQLYRQTSRHDFVDSTLLTEKTETGTLEASLSEEEAIDLIQTLPEVQEWLAAFSGPDGSSPVTGGFPAFTVDSIDPPMMLIHVYENSSERSITFGWYEVHMTEHWATSTLPHI